MTTPWWLQPSSWTHRRPGVNVTAARGERRPWGIGDGLAVAALVGLGLLVFGPHMIGLTTYIGNSDRLHTFLNIRKFEVDALQTIARVPTWNDAIFMGSPTYGLYWMFPGFDPPAVLAAMFPGRDVFRVSGYISAAHLIAAALAAYLAIRDIVPSPFPAVVGAGLYACSVFSVHRISQVDAAFAVLILLPLGLLVLRRVRQGSAALGFVAMTAIVAMLVGLTFLQEAAYTLLFFGLYATYRLIVVRAWQPFVILGGASMTGFLIATPRLGTVVDDIRELSRSSSIFGPCPCELLRWFDEGIYGRFPAEAAALGNGINLHEGFQLYMSTFATLAIIVGLFRPRGAVSVLLGAALVGTMGFVASLVGSNGYFFFEHDLWIIPAMLAGFGWLRAPMAQWWGMPHSEFIRDRDLWFFTGFVAVAFTVMLYDDARYWLYLAFFSMDFSHSRISVAALLPLSILAAAFVHELFSHEADMDARTVWSHRGVLVVAAMLSGLFLLLHEPLAGMVSALVFGSGERLSLGPWIFMSSKRLGGIIVAGTIFVLLLIIHWFARHVQILNTPGTIELRWYHAERDGARSALRVVPAYLLGCLMLMQALGNAYFQVNGAHTQTFPDPFFGNNNLGVPPDVLRPPSTAARQAIRDRLEADAFRSVIVSAPNGYPTYEAPSERGYTAHVAQLWNLRLVEGYPMLPRRLTELPWPDENRSLRSLFFADQRTLPWPLLAMLNVKYAVVASPSLLLNVSSSLDRTREAILDDFTILENPLSPLPRAFFAESIVARPGMATTARLSVPTAPKDIRVTVNPDRSVLFAWSGDRHDATYRILRRQISPTPEPTLRIVHETKRGVQTYTHPPIGESAIVYEFRIQACTIQGCGDLSAPVEARAASRTIRVPTSMDVRHLPNAQVLVTWVLDDSSATTVIDLATLAGVPIGEPMTVAAGVRSYIVTGLYPLQRYRIRLQACGRDGCSSHTSELLTTVPSSFTADDFRGVLPADPIRQSLVDDLPENRSFGPSASEIRGYYEADRVTLRFEPTQHERFLVVNDMYHQAWHAYDGKAELKIWPTNIVMRGVMVPAGVSKIDMRFEPFAVSWISHLSVTIGILMTVLGWLVIRKLDNVRTDDTASSDNFPPSLRALRSPFQRNKPSVT